MAQAPVSLGGDDGLELRRNPLCQKMLHKLGDNFPEPEKVVLSAKLIKINKRNKQQDRVMLITDKALYNLKAKDYSKCKRRIELEKIVSITLTTSTEFALHIPEEYDYRFRSNDKDRIVHVLSELYLKKEGKKLAVQKTDSQDTADKVVTKDKARIMTREDRLARFRKLMDISYEDEVRDAHNAQVTGQLMDSTEKSKPDDFEFLKVIGRGSFGKVMQVRKKDTGEIFAMKILKKKALIAKHQVEHTNAERKILQQLQHPFLMHLRFAFQTDAKLYFVLDYYRGGELFFHLKKKRRFSEAQAQIIVGEVAMALGHLHSMDVIYRDLKPENILLDHSGHICLTDFGLSKDLGPSHNDAHTFCGTPEYLAPEIVMNLGHGKAVDWWSLGILLYELTVGIPPFYSQNVNEMYRKIQEAPLLFPPNLSNPCKDLVTKLLERDPKKRLGSSGDDIKEIMIHSFFKNIDWDKLYSKEIEALYKPNVSNEADDAQCFDEMFLKEAVVDSHATAPTLASAQDDGFGGFTYVQKGSALS